MSVTQAVFGALLALLALVAVLAMLPSKKNGGDR